MQAYQCLDNADNQGHLKDITQMLTGDNTSNVCKRAMDEF